MLVDSVNSTPEIPKAVMTQSFSAIQMHLAKTVLKYLT